MTRIDLATARVGPARALLAALCGWACAVSGTAAAATLPPAGVIGGVSFNQLTPAPIDVDHFGSFPLDSPMGSLRLDLGPTPSPFVTASAEIAPFFFGRANAIVQYSVQVLGTTPLPPLSVKFAVAGGATGTSSAGGAPGDLFHGFGLQARWSVDSSTRTLSSGGISFTGQNSFSDAFSRTEMLDLEVNTIYRVTLVADASARSGSASAFIDPVFSFAPGVGDGYSFVFSDGIGNAPVPEPAPYALLAAGLLVLGAARRRAQA